MKGPLSSFKGISRAELGSEIEQKHKKRALVGHAQYTYLIASSTSHLSIVLITDMPRPRSKSQIQSAKQSAFSILTKAQDDYKSSEMSEKDWEQFEAAQKRYNDTIITLEREQKDAEEKLQEAQRATTGSIWAQVRNIRQRRFSADAVHFRLLHADDCCGPRTDCASLTSRFGSSTAHGPRIAFGLK